MKAEDPQLHQRVIERTRSYTWVIFFGTLVLFVILVWSLRTLLLPILVGALLAYILIPVVSSFSRFGVPRLWSVILLVLLIFAGLFYTFSFTINQLPDNEQKLQMRVTALYQLNERYENLMQIGEAHEQPNWLYEFIGAETDPAMDYVNLLIALNKQETEQFIQSLENSPVPNTRQERLMKLHEHNLSLNLYASEGKLHDAAAYQSSTFFSRSQEPLTESERGSTLSMLVNIFSIWLLMPVFFFFFLLDKGRFIKQMVSSVPNMFFEMTLTSLRNVDKAIGMYLRGTFLESIAVFACFMIALLIIGFNFTAAVLISLVCAVLNIIPLVGSVAGIMLCMAYALVIEDVNSILPFVNESNIILLSAMAAILVQVVDNTLLKPYILGNATDIHPIMVIVVVMGGGVLFGFWGVLLAIPFVVIVKVSVQTIHERLIMYRIIRF